MPCRKRRTSNGLCLHLARERGDPEAKAQPQSEVQPDGKAQPFLTSGGEAEANVSCRSGDLL